LDRSIPRVLAVADIRVYPRISDLYPQMLDATPTGSNPRSRATALQAVTPTGLDPGITLPLQAPRHHHVPYTPFLAVMLMLLASCASHAVGEEADTIGSVDRQNGVLGVMQGQWTHAADSLVHIEVMDTLWIEWYLGSAYPPDTSIIHASDHYRQCVDPSVRADIVHLVNGVDSLTYELVGSTEDSFTLLYCTRGNLHEYRRIRKP
jgi:hypothetical protein